MEFIRNTWNVVTNTVTDWWYYFFGARGSEQLLLEYVIMDEDLSSQYINTGVNIKPDETYKKFIDDHDKKTLTNGSKYTFLFEQNDY